MPFDPCCFPFFCVVSFSSAGLLHLFDVVMLVGFSCVFSCVFHVYLGQYH